MFMVRIKEKGGEDQMLPFEKEEVSIGRGKGNDIILPKGNVSKRHARVVHRDGKFIVVDLRSTNGTYFNARKISSPVIVTPQDKIYIGDFVLRVIPGGPEEADAYKSEPAISITPPAAGPEALPPIDVEEEIPFEEPDIPFEEPEIPFEEPEIPFEEPEIPFEEPEVPFEEPAAAPVSLAPEPVVETPTEDEDDYGSTRSFDVSEIEEPGPLEPEEVPFAAPEQAEWTPAEAFDVPFDTEEPESLAYVEPEEEEPLELAEPAHEAPVTYTEEEYEDLSDAVPVAEPLGGEGLLLELARDSQVQQITAFGPTRIFVTRSGVRSRHPAGYADDASWRADVHAILRRLGVDPAKAPELFEAAIQPGLQVRVLSAPLAVGGPICQINKAPERGATMETLKNEGVLDEEAADVLADAVETGRNVLVLGPPRSGRTTLLNALAYHLPESALIVVAEEKPEVHLPHAGVIRLQLGETSEQKTSALRQLRRIGADAVIVGSLPTRMLPTFLETAYEAATLVLASATGRNLERFVQHALALCQPAAAAAGLLAEALDVLVLMDRSASGACRVAQIAALEEGPDGRLGLESLYGG